MRDKRDLRLFFALWPDEVIRRQLQRQALSLAIDRDARRVPEYNLHLTLHFIGNIPRVGLDCLQQRAREVIAEPFVVEIDETGSFVKPKVAWLGCREMPVALDRLHQDLGKRLRGCGFKPEKRRFNPHVTVARKISSPPPAPTLEPVIWPVDRFALIESRADQNGVKYWPIEEYYLT